MCSEGLQTINLKKLLPTEKINRRKLHYVLLSTTHTHTHTVITTITFIDYDNIIFPCYFTTVCLDIQQTVS